MVTLANLKKGISQKMQITVGVVIPVYNRPKTAIEAITSAIKQSRPPEKIIVIDDCSDPPLELPTQLLNHTGLEVHRLKKNSGASAARQAGVNALDTTHVAFLDSDDTWLPEKLALQCDYLQSQRNIDKIALSCGWEWVNDETNEIVIRIPKPSDDLKDFVSGCWYCPGTAVMMPCQSIRAIGGFDTTLRRLEDLDLFIRFASADGQLHVVPQAAARIHRGRNAHTKHVSDAVNTLRKKYAKDGTHHLPPHIYRRLESWLNVELAATHRNNANYLSAALSLAKSLALVPRTQIQLQQWFE